MAESKPLKIGASAPKFSLPDQDGAKVRLADLVGQWVVLYFYPRDNTPGCTTEACDFTNGLKQFESLGAVIIGVSPDSEASHRKFIDKHKLTVTLLSDTDRAVLKKYSAWGIKNMYGKEVEGVIRSTVLIDPAGKITHIWPKVKVKGHVEAVRDKLKKLSV
jgi:peroxiredoxin Q/BCP